MSQFLKLTKIKIKIVLYFFALSFLFGILFSAFNRVLIESAISEEKFIFLSQYILPIPYFILTFLKFYLFSCIAIYFINKGENKKEHYREEY